MAFISFPVAPSASTEPAFRNWGKAISQALGDATGSTGIGLIRVEQSSPPITGSTPISGWTTAQLTEWAWEIWKLPNATSPPLYIRIGYGSNSTTNVRLQMQFGTSYTAPGGGVLSGVNGTGSISVLTGNGGTTTPSTCYAGSDGDGFYIIFHPSLGGGGANQLAGYVVVDRHRDGTGAAQSTGFACYATYHLLNNVNCFHASFASPDSTFQTSGTTAPCLTPTTLSASSSNLNANNQTTLYPWWSVTKDGMGLSKMIATYAMPDLTGMLNANVLWLPSHDGATSRVMLPVGSLIQGPHDVFSSAGASVAFWVSG